MTINSGVTFAKPITFMSGGNITLAGQLTDSYSGTAVVIDTLSDFINTAGSTALNLTGTTPRWLIYSTSVNDDMMGGLSPDHTVNSQTYVSDPPGSVGFSGNVWIYSSGGIITLTADDKSMVYGASVPTLTYSFACSTLCTQGAAITGTPSLSTAVTSATNVGSYAISIAAGSVALTGPYAGYTLDYVPGTLSVNAAPLTITGSADLNDVLPKLTNAKTFTVLPAPPLYSVENAPEYQAPSAGTPPDAVSDAPTALPASRAKPLAPHPAAQPTPPIACGPSYSETSAPRCSRPITAEATVSARALAQGITTIRGSNNAGPPFSVTAAQTFFA